MDQATAQQYLTEAITTRHEWMVGNRTVECHGPDGRMLRYGEVSMAELNGYIAYLTPLAQPVRSDGTPAGRRPIGFRFGR